MPDDLTRDDLTRLRAEVAAMRADQVAAQARHATAMTELAALRRLVSPPRRRRAPLPALCLALLLALVPLGLLAANPFADLTGGVHDANIDAIYNAGITTGCVPPPAPNPRYCPTDGVTREEMASFLARLGGLGGNPPVANASTLQGRAPSGLVRVARGLGDSSVGATYGQAAYVTIDAPAAGFVLVTGTLSIYGVTYGPASPCPCTIRAYLHDQVADDRPPYEVATPFSGSTGNAALAQTWVFPVTAGTRIFTFQARQTGHTGGSALVTGEITALYVPFGPTGTTAIGAR